MLNKSKKEGETLRRRITTTCYVAGTLGALFGGAVHRYPSVFVSLFSGQIEVTILEKVPTFHRLSFTEFRLTEILFLEDFDFMKKGEEPYTNVTGHRVVFIGLATLFGSLSILLLGVLQSEVNAVRAIHGFVTLIVALCGITSHDETLDLFNLCYQHKCMYE